MKVLFPILQLSIILLSNGQRFNSSGLFDKIHFKARDNEENTTEMKIKNKKAHFQTKIEIRINIIFENF